MKLLTTIFLISIISTITFTQPLDGLVAYYPFNGNANDESGNGHNAIANIPNHHSSTWGNI